jgi:hypothetical protein
MKTRIRESKPSWEQTNYIADKSDHRFLKAATATTLAGAAIFYGLPEVIDEVTDTKNYCINVSPIPNTTTGLRTALENATQGPNGKIYGNIANGINYSDVASDASRVIYKVTGHNEREQAGDDEFEVCFEDDGDVTKLGYSGQNRINK